MSPESAGAASFKSAVPPGAATIGVGVLADGAGLSANGGARPVLRQFELVERVRAYDPTVDEDALNRAYVFAMRAHGVQKRASGDPYFHHPVEVAGILASMRLDTASIVTGLLHDTVEDTGVSLEEIGKLFGEEVRRLVDGVTKLNKLDGQSPQTAQAENFRKLLLATSEDIRVLLVKLADRLHNMRTLRFIKKPEKRARIAAETMEIYAPLAERIGMDQLRAELEDLAFMHLKPEARESIVIRLRQLRQDDHGLIDRICASLLEPLRSAGIEAKVWGREKSPWSIWRKMERKNVNFEQLADIMAFRIIVDDVGQCYAALGAIHGAFSMVPGRFKDFVSMPKPNGYRSLHTTVIGPERRAIEIQIRTRAMHEIAEMGVAAHWDYKQYGQGAKPRPADGKQYRWVRELLDVLEHAAGPEEFLEHTKLEIFSDQVFCFTPRGDLIALPRGATPVDFAYAVHSEVGDQCVGAQINGRWAPLRTLLKNGDQVEIKLQRGSTPSAEWERFVVTANARARIRRHLRSQRREDFAQSGREAIARHLGHNHKPPSDKALEPIAAAFGENSVEELLIGAGQGRISARLIVDTLHPAETPSSPPEEQALRHLKRERDDDAVATAIVGLPPGVPYQFARCCRPVRGERIAGVVRSGRAVVIHERNCAHLARNCDRRRMLDLDWGEERGADIKTAAVLSVTTANRPGALGEVSTLIGKQAGNISDLRSGRRSEEIFEMLFEVEVEDLAQLQTIIGGLRAAPFVLDVERVRE